MTLSNGNIRPETISFNASVGKVLARIQLRAPQEECSGGQLLELMAEHITFDEWNEANRQTTLTASFQKNHLIKRSVKKAQNEKRRRKTRLFWLLVLLSLLISLTLTAG